MTAALFRRLYGCEPEVEARAPGRVNMIGDHTDYNEGFVLPIAIPQRTCVTLARGDALPHEAYSATLGEHVKFEQAPGKGFAGYLAGCLAVVGEIAGETPPLRFLVESTVPVGIGLSSSAALEVATLRALDALLGLGLGPVDIAKLAQRAEVEYVGVKCGIMDQMASSLASTTQMLLIDTRTLETTLRPLPEGASLVVVASGVTRSLAQSAYNERRDECARAAARLGVRSLRDVEAIESVDGLPSPLRERARHVISENKRVLAAANTRDPVEFGALMNASHASLRDDYAVSIAKVDQIIESLQGDDAVFGARMTGAGFGGACVALVKSVNGLDHLKHCLAAFFPGAKVIVPEQKAYS